ncbi:hypothetical protein CORC01_00611 [Colletotrichum orchidophilum]|uniref:Peptidase S8/S53 domain-containing protein n=1 Tax=Colletotrichum orchidophilum TaxID=1209926 RepID=A0A1G4BS41_9PEZI|nr:uncharacterized protein CORC01_00611 [Colletotrichum orchidophilum]OHF04272.1 hypothetical protein CORC01_00611 [Colletotrichum orchidophilum]
MFASIAINGKRVALSHDLDCSSTDYIIIRTTGDPLNKQQKAQLSELGVNVAEFVGDEEEQIYLCGYPKNSLVQIDKLDFINYVGIYSDEFVLPPVVVAASQTATVHIDVLLHSDVSSVADELLQKIADAADVRPSDITVGDGSVQIKVDVAKLNDIAALDEVRVLHTANEAALFNNVARGILKFDDAMPVKNTGYRGKGQIVCVADTGFDNGTSTDAHDAFAGRVKALYSWGRAEKGGATDDIDGHGTHVCGSVLGNGLHASEGLIEGTAPDAELIVQSLFSGFNPFKYDSPMLGGIPKGSLSPLFSQAYDAGARIHTNSWGSALPPLTRIQRPYDGRSESIDQFVWDHQDMTILFAAGNDGQDIDTDGKVDGTVNPRSLGAEAASKNCITVGATENLRPDLMSGDSNRPYTYGGFWSQKFPRNPLKDDHMADNPEGLAAFSSRGPTTEDRLKPDVVAPGTAILSARSQNKRFLTSINLTGVSGDSKYMYLSGTSMATPLVAGTCAVIREALLETGYLDEQDGVKNPTGSLLKALLINGAEPIKGQYIPPLVSAEPNPHSGYGRVNVVGSLPRLNDPLSGYGIGIADEDGNGPFHLAIPIPAPTVNGATRNFKVTLAYADLPGGKLQNDLNLIVVIGGEELHGNQNGHRFVLGSKKMFDRRNNVEQVLWENLPKDAKSVKVIVKVFRFMASRVPFAYAWKFTSAFLDHTTILPDMAVYRAKI